ncbi:MAG TPA: hypothetical protein VMM36_02325, partial [Opitutaceae bacterium]|nr:hypothetical protein [Opitutaceae bacterium]
MNGQTPEPPVMLPPSSSQLPQFHIVGFTGHRKLVDSAITEKCIALVLASLREGSTGEWLATSSAAQGGDLIFARQVIAAGIAWEAVLPLAPADFQKDFSPEGWREVEALLAQAKTVRVVSSFGSRDEAYLDCGIETVNTCDVLIAVWDGEPARGRGGTADVVAF